MNTNSNLAKSVEKLKLVAVTKNRSVPEITDMLQKTGITRIAENRLHEAEEKFPSLPQNLEKHFIGKLQSRKIPKIVELFDVIQSVENLKQAEKISKHASSLGRNIQVLLQVNISDLPQRSGCLPEEVFALTQKISSLPNIELIGIMGMASSHPEEEFHLLKSLQGTLPECSMGMSNDYNIAIQEGSTMLRLGSALFQENLPALPPFE